MTETNTIDDIIDIDPENVVEHKPEDPKPNAPKPRRTASLRVVALVALVSALAGTWLYRDVLSSYLPSDQVQAMATRMDVLEASTATLNQKVDAVVGLTDEIKSQLVAAQAQAALIPTLQSDADKTSAAIAALQKSVAAASASVDEIKTQISSGASSSGGDTSVFSGKLASLEKDIASLKSAAGTSPDQTALSQSLADLKAKIAAGLPYQDEFDRILRMVPAAEGLDVLGAHAATGLPDAKGLAAELAKLAETLPKPEAQTSSSDSSWWNYASNMMSGLITVKAAGVDDWAQLARQVSDLAAQGQLAGAVAALEKTESTLPVELQNWHDRAAARVALELALDKTSGAVLRQIAAKG